MFPFLPARKMDVKVDEWTDFWTWNAHKVYFIFFGPYRMKITVCSCPNIESLLIETLPCREIKSVLV